MDQETFSAVDEFVAATLAPDDEALRGALEAAEAAGLPSIQVSPPQGKLLQMLARLLGARTVLEFGTLGGYSTILLARALPEGGKLITLEADPGYAEVARGSIERAGLGDVVELRVGPALDTLPRLEEEGAGPFDLVFIDADKVNTPNYFAWALDHVRPGSLIVADNVVRGGTLAEAESEDAATHAQRHLHEMLAGEPRISATTIQTVGVKGYDGFTVALVDG
jgi:predicted O-methyltransferase YrrM